MVDFHNHKIQLTEGQKRKLRFAYKKRKTAVIGLNKNQLTAGDGENIMLTNDQYKAVNKAIKNNSGVRLILDFSQLVKNQEGGLLKEVLELAENNVPYVKKYISPLIKQNVAPLLKDHFIPWLKKLIDEELDEIIEKDPKGEGLRRYISHELKNVLSQARVKKT